MEDVGGVSEAPSFEVKVNSPTKTDVTGKVLWEPCIRLASILAIQKITVVTGIIEIYSPQKKLFFVGDTSLSGLFFIVILVYRGVNVFCFNDLG